MNQDLKVSFKKEFKNVITEMTDLLELPDKYFNVAMIKMV